MKLNNPIQKLTLAAVLSALTVAIDVMSKLIISSPTFGLPFYSIPLILGSIILGPIYGATMAFVADGLSVVSSGTPYLPFFVLSDLAWGIIPGLILHKRFTVQKLLIAVYLAYLFATTSNTIAIFIYFGRMAAYTTLALRLTMAIFNSILIFYIVKDIYLRLVPLHEKFHETKLIKTYEKR